MTQPIGPAPAKRRRPVALTVAPDHVSATDARGRTSHWPRHAVGGLRLSTAGIADDSGDGWRTPKASGLAVHGADGSTLAELDWWGNAHAPLEQAAATAGLPLDWQVGRTPVTGQPVQAVPRRRGPTGMSLVLSRVDIRVTGESAAAVFPRIGYGPVPAARLRLYRDYTTEAWVKAVALVDPWRRELCVVRWDGHDLAALGKAADAAGMLVEFRMDSGRPESLGSGPSLP